MKIKIGKLKKCWFGFVVENIPITVEFDTGQIANYNLLTGDEIYIDTKKVGYSKFKHKNRMQLKWEAEDKSIERAIKILEDNGVIEDGKILLKYKN